MRLQIVFLGVLSVIGLAATEGWAASLPNPQLTALDSGVNDEEAISRALELADLQVQVEIVGNLAETTLTARFVNPTHDDLEGTFTLQMPDGAVVTGYALDVDSEDQMIDGVLMPPVRARLVFDEKLRAGIDPGIAEVRHGNVFRTRVYPIFEKGRTIRLKFAAPVSATRGYVLPLVSGAKIGQARLSVRVRNADASPALSWPAALKSEWRRENGDLVNEVSLEGGTLDGDLSIAPAAIDGRAFVTRHANGRRFVELRDVASGQPTVTPTPPRSLRVYWDRSSSRRDDALAREHDLLKRYLAATSVANIEVVWFNSSGTTASSSRDAAAITRTLRGLDYRGATSFAVLSGKTSGKADVCLLFSDGIATIDARPELRFGCTLNSITSAPDADLGYLGLLARGNGGAVVSLARMSVDEALRLLQSPAPRVLEARSEQGESLRFASFDAGERGWALVVDAPLHGDLILRLAGIEAGIVERRYGLLNDLGQFSGAGALWAGNRVMEMAGDAQREAELRELSQRYSVASPAMSFIVFEAPEDYVHAGVAPPANYPDELMEEYLEAKQGAAEDAAERQEDWLAELIDRWEGQKEWWADEYVPARTPREEEPENVLATSPGTPNVAAPVPAPAPGASDVGAMPDRPAAALQRVSPPTSVAAEMNSSVEEIAVTGFRTSDTGPKISLQLEPWNPDRPYLKALDSAESPGEFARELDAQESRHGSMPAFYFDVAEWLYRHQRVPEAIDMLLSALELPAQDSQTLALVADRLQRYGAIDRAVWAYEQVHRMEPHRPQPARNLARALSQRAKGLRGAAARADLERAMALLTELIMTPPDYDYEGIELVMLMDANAIIPRLRAAGSRKVDLDPRLIGLLDVDLRVVIEWNTPGTDMDLWVDQPDEERAIYSNPLTDIGGQLSNDMTSGYGPEQYLLRRSINGEYAIKVNVYSADAINPNGATMITAHLTRNYGRRGEQTETMELELKPGDEGEMLVGRFRVGRSRLSASNDRLP